MHAAYKQGCRCQCELIPKQRYRCVAVALCPDFRLCAQAPHICTPWLYPQRFKLKLLALLKHYHRYSAERQEQGMNRLSHCIASNRVQPWAADGSSLCLALLSLQHHLDHSSSLYVG